MSESPVLARAKRTFGEAYYRRQLARPLERRTIFYEAFAGAGIVCNPQAVFHALLDDPARNDWKHVWTIASDELREQLRYDYREHANVRFVAHRSREYYRAVATSSHLVNNVSFGPMVRVRNEQRYLNTWHGTPLKRMGRDSGATEAELANTIANFRSADVFLSTGDYMTQVMYRDAFGLTDDEIAARVLASGQPRVDVQFDPAAPDRTRSLLARLGRPVDGRQVVFYAPTWQQASTHEALDDTAELADRVHQMSIALGSRPSRLFIRVHQKVAEAAAQNPVLARYLLPSKISTNAMLGVTDLLITDYSSVVFDYVAGLRPPDGDSGPARVVFVPPASGEYPRGAYLAPDQLPGPSARDLDQLTRWLHRPSSLPPAPTPASQVHRERCPAEQGRATAAVLDAFFTE